MTELQNLRGQIDEIDQNLVLLLEKRMEISLKVGEYKKKNNMPILDPARENAVIQSRISLLADQNLKDVIREVFEHIMRLSREYQERCKD